MAERTLRERCIEAGAEALSAVSPAFNDREDAVVAVFDAIIGVLTEHADEYGHGASCFDMIAAMKAVSDD